MLTLSTNLKAVRRQKYLIEHLKSLPINILPSFQKSTLNTKNILGLVQNIQSLREDQRSGMNFKPGKKKKYNPIPYS